MTDARFKKGDRVRVARGRVYLEWTGIVKNVRFEKVFDDYPDDWTYEVHLYAPSPYDDEVIDILEEACLEYK